MKRIALTDGSGKWFDANKARKFEEETFWNGNNHISKATGSQTEHETMYVTASGLFVLNCWSQWQGSVDTFELVSKGTAANWFARQGFADEDMPEELVEQVYGLEL
jgi:hypothetical protein